MTNLLQSLRAFLLGMWEFRSDYTSNPGDDVIEIYDAGRNFAHRMTFRKFDY